MKRRMTLQTEAGKLVTQAPRRLHPAAKLPVLGVIALALLLLPSTVTAKLPEPSPEQARAAADKKAQADAQAEKDKQALAVKMDDVTQRWRKRAAEKGWKAHSPTAVKPIAGIDASSSQSGASGQPGGKVGEAAKDQPIRSEKRGTAPPSQDVKQPGAQQQQQQQQQQLQQRPAR